MENQLAKDNVLSYFFKDHPEAAATVLMKSDSEQISKLIVNFSNDTLIHVLKFLPISLLEETLAKLDDTHLKNVLIKIPVNATASIFHQWKLKKRMDATRIEALIKELEPKYAASVKKLLQYSANTIGSIMSTTPFSVRDNLSVGEVLTILKKDQERYS